MSRRLFVALPPDEAASNHLQDFVALVGPPAGDIRATEPAGWHVTLAFLDQVGDEIADDYVEQLAELLAGFTPCQLALRGGGAFGPPDAARTWWAGVADPSGTLPELNQVCRRAAQRCGIRVAAEKKYFPHLTLYRGRPRPSHRWMRSWEDYRGPEWSAHRVHLMESLLLPGAAHYRTVTTFELRDYPG